MHSPRLLDPRFSALTLMATAFWAHYFVRQEIASLIIAGILTLPVIFMLIVHKILEARQTNAFPSLPEIDGVVDCNPDGFMGVVGPKDEIVREADEARRRIREIKRDAGDCDEYVDDGSARPPFGLRSSPDEIGGNDVC